MTGRSFMTFYYIMKLLRNRFISNSEEQLGNFY